MIEKVISGGQIGADIAGLRAARKLGIPTGGFAPEGFKTKDGENPELGSVYGLVDSRLGYAARTELNVFGSDGTIRFASNWKSPGELCTAKWVRRYVKPCFDVPLKARMPNGWAFQAGQSEVAAWLLGANIKVLNVAGNGNALMEAQIEEFLSEVFNLVKTYA